LSNKIRSRTSLKNTLNLSNIQSSSSYPEKLERKLKRKKLQRKKIPLRKKKLKLRMKEKIKKRKKQKRKQRLLLSKFGNGTQLMKSRLSG